MMRGDDGSTGYDAAEAFYAALSARLKLVPVTDDPMMQTIATDGESLFYYPEWICQLDNHRKGDLHTVIVKLAMHCAHQHHARMPAECNTDPAKCELANIAASLSVNGILHDSGFTLPLDSPRAGEGFFKDWPANLSMEMYYEKLKDLAGNLPSFPEFGQLIPCNSPVQAQEQKETWKLAVAQFENSCKDRGDISENAKRLIQGILNPAHDLETVLREYICRVAHDKHNWNTRNRRFHDVYLPGKLNHEMGEIVLALDTSGSITQEVLKKAVQIAQGIIENNPARLTVLSHDSAVCNVQTWVNGDPPLEIVPKGGGGTSHVPVFKHIEKMEEQPDVIVCLTDCYTDYPQHGPECDVIWARFDGGGTVPPFGRLVDVVA